MIPTAPAWLFPARLRRLPAERAINITLRTLHLVGIAGLGGAYLYSVPDERWRPYLWLTLANGAALSLLGIHAHGIWLLQLRGQVILFKLLLLGLAALFPAFRTELFWAVLILSGWIAHAPGATRYHSLYHRRRIDTP